MDIQLTKELIINAQAGDTQAFEYITNLYIKKVYYYVLNIFCNEEDAHDLTQEIFIKVFKKIGSFNWDSEFYTWLYRIMSNTCRDELRRRKVRRLLCFWEGTHDHMEQIEDKDSQCPLENFSREEQRQQLHHGINQLPRKQREIINLRYINELSIKDIALVTRLAEGTVKATLFKATANLKKSLGDNYEM